MNGCSETWRYLCRTPERKTSAVISTLHIIGSARMKRFLIAVAVSAAALLGGTAANASDNTVKAKAATDVTQSSPLRLSSLPPVL
jgi:hypothetical protein